MTLTYNTLLARPREPALIYNRDTFPDQPGWDDLVREGHLVPIVEGIAHHRMVTSTAAIRAAALRPWLSRQAILADASAAWVHAPEAAASLTGAAPPGTRIAHRVHMHRGPVHLIYGQGCSRPTASPDILVRRTILLEGDVVELSTTQGPAVPVTSPTRTALDIASRWDPQVAEPVVHALVDAGADPEAALRRLARAGHWVGREQATELLDRAALA